MRAAGGRTLGLFSSMRAAKEATEAMRERFDGDIGFLCQGEDQITTLVRQFARDPRTCLFGTLTLWQGVDVPGSACQLVIIDRIPFPRPDDPLSSARSQAIARMGGNGFMAVSATHAALRLSQGAGRLSAAPTTGVWSPPRLGMMTARYAGSSSGRCPRSGRPPTGACARRPRAAGRDGGAADGGARSRRCGGSPARWSARPWVARRGRDRAPASRRGRSAAGRVGPDGGHGGHAWTEESDEELRDGVELGLRSTSSPRASSCPPTSWQPASRAWASRPTAPRRCPSTERPLGRVAGNPR